LYASTFVGGIENNHSTTDPTEGIGDFNDMIFQLSGSGLSLVTPNGQWNAFNAGVVNQTGAGTPAGNPYFDDPSADGTNMNVGYCLTTANCNAATQTAGASMTRYLSATGNTSAPAADFWFTFSSATGAILLDAITPNASTESVGIYDMTSHAVTWFITNGALTLASIPTSAAPSGAFGLIFELGTNGTFYYSQNPELGFFNGVAGSPAASRFAIFGDTQSSVPEPTTLALFGIGALAMGLIPKLRKRR
jgi:hypothetical protein